MSSLQLLRLTTNEFTDSIGFVLPPAPLRRVLQQSLDVKRLALAIRYGQNTGQDVRKFVAHLLSELRPGELFRHDIALAALAVALEHWHTSFAEEYLIDLARVQRSEFRASFRIAGECLKARYSFPRTQARTFRYPQGSGQRVPGNVRPMPRLEQGDRHAIGYRRLRYTEVSYARS